MRLRHRTFRLALATALTSVALLVPATATHAGGLPCVGAAGYTLLCV